MTRSGLFRGAGLFPAALALAGAERLQVACVGRDAVVEDVLPIGRWVPWRRGRHRRRPSDIPRRTSPRPSGPAVVAGRSLRGTAWPGCCGSAGRPSRRDSSPGYGRCRLRPGPGPAGRTGRTGTDACEDSIADGRDSSTGPGSPAGKGRTDPQAFTFRLRRCFERYPHT